MISSCVSSSAFSKSLFRNSLIPPNVAFISIHCIQLYAFPVNCFVNFIAMIKCIVPDNNAQINLNIVIWFSRLTETRGVFFRVFFQLLWSMSCVLKPVPKSFHTFYPGPYLVPQRCFSVICTCLNVIYTWFIIINLL